MIISNISLGELLNLKDSLYDAVQMSDCMDLIPISFNAYAVDSLKEKRTVIVPRYTAERKILPVEKSTGKHPSSRGF